MRTLQHYVQVEPDDTHAYVFLAMVYERLGRHDDVLAALDTLAVRGRPVSPFHKAAIHVTLGEHETALELLEEAVRQPSQQLRLLGVRSVWDPLRDDPRFHTLLQRVGLR